MSSAPGVELTIDALREGYRRGRFTVLEVMERCLQRIEELDRRGPGLNAMIAIDDTVREHAVELDKTLASNTELPPLHGVPLVIKDNINVGGLATTGGCAALAELRPTEDAVVVDRLKAAGAVVLGKSSMSEFAWGTYDTQNSVIHGYTRNPYHIDYAAGGSSGGTGVAIAAGYCVVGLGTDTGCSVRAPASINCLVGLRPTHGLVDMRGVMPMNVDWDTVGPMARTVRDLATVLDVLVGESGATSPGPYECALAREARVRVGVVRQLAEPSESDPAVVRLLGRAVADLEAAGVSVIDPVESDVFSVQFDTSDWYLRFRFDLDNFLVSLGDCSPVASLREILDTGVVLDRYVEPIEASLNWPYEPAEHPRLEQMQAITNCYRDAFLDLLERHCLDALVFPTFRFPPVLNGSLAGEHVGSEAPVGSNNYFASLTGFPALSVPMGFVEPGLPIGLQLLGRPHAEARLLQIAFRYERKVRHRRPPDL